MFGLAVLTTAGIAHADTPPATVPGNIIDLTNWKLTLPVAAEDSDGPAEIEQPELATYTSPEFALTETADGVRFRATVDGATTSGSKYPRSELREMTDGGAAKAAWSTTSGTHAMSLRAAITHLPEAKPEVVVAQVHDAEDDVLMIRLEGEHLFVEHDGDNLGDLDPAYVLGTPFDAEIVAENGRITVSYNGAEKVDAAIKTTGNYFKAGCYTQSNTDQGDEPDAYGETVIHRLNVTHS
ncbi:polysaccharide lyase family 7 protein [Actinomycetes bacterium KLBMP 9797]